MFEDIIELSKVLRETKLEKDKGNLEKARRFLKEIVHRDFKTIVNDCADIIYDGIEIKYLDGGITQERIYSINEKGFKTYREVDKHRGLRYRVFDGTEYNWEVLVKVKELFEKENNCTGIISKYVVTYFPVDCIVLDLRF